MRRALDALTVVRLGAPPGARAHDALAYPLVGALLGLVWVLVGRSVSLYLGPAVAAGAIVLVDAWLTRAQHLDGLAAVVDGSATEEDPDDAIAVMRDPAVGALGVAAMLGLGLVRFGLLIQLAFPPGPVLLGIAPLASLGLVGPVAAGRLAIVVCHWQVPWRTDEPGGRRPDRPPTLVVALATLLTFALAAPAGWRGVAAVGVALVVTAAFLGWWLRRHGALVAEAPAAACLLAETAALAVVVAAI